MDKETILKIAKREGCFTVSLKYRCDKLRKKCSALCREGRLRRQKKIVHGCDVYVPVEQVINGVAQ